MTTAVISNSGSYIFWDTVKILNNPFYRLICKFGAAYGVPVATSACARSVRLGDLSSSARTGGRDYLAGGRRNASAAPA